MKKFILITILCLLTLQCEQGWLKDILAPLVEGCNDSTACNYNVDAKEDDGSCIFKQGCNEWCEGDALEVQEIDCNGLCGVIAIIDSCSVCSGGTTSITPCNQDCSGSCGGLALEDSCGNCDYDSSNDCVQDCEGTCGGNIINAECGMCGG